LYKLTYCLNNLGEYETFAEAFSVLYKKLREDSKDGFSLQLLETAIWIDHDGYGSPIFFYDIVDRANKQNLLKDGQLDEKVVKEAINKG
jgi:hypothetical protein